MISIKFGELVGGWNTGDIRDGYDIGLWKDIRKDWSTFSQNVVFSLGDDRRLCFWKDTWCGEVALCNSFLTLFNMAALKDAKVADVWDISMVEGVWSVVFLRSFNDWEVEKFLHFLHRRKIMPCQEDQLLMDFKADGFSVRLMYKLLVHPSPIAWFIWNPIVPSKLRFFA